MTYHSRRWVHSRYEFVNTSKSKKLKTTFHYPHQLLQWRPSDYRRFCHEREGAMKIIFHMREKKEFVAIWQSLRDCEINEWFTKAVGTVWDKLVLIL